jgi:hypothetical protein
MFFRYLTDNLIIGHKAVTNTSTGPGINFLAIFQA